MYKNTLNRAGLSSAQSSIYEVLIKNGPLSAGDISDRAGIKRGLTYKALDELEEMGIIDKSSSKSKIAIFTPNHPFKLRELAETREHEGKDAQLALSSILDQLVSDFNLSVGKPGIQFFEGDNGVLRVLEDSLTTKTEILSFADLEAIQKYIPKVNEKYVKQRNALKIKKRGITLDTPFVRDFLKDYYPGITQTKLISVNDAPNFQTVMQIYDGKISYITLSEKGKIGVIIEDKNIFGMHKYIFEYLWSATPIFDPQKSNK